MRQSVSRRTVSPRCLVAPVDKGRVAVVVSRLDVQHRQRGRERVELVERSLVWRSGQQLHHHRLGHRGQVTCRQHAAQRATSPGVARSQVVDPTEASTRFIGWLARGSPSTCASRQGRLPSPSLQAEKELPGHRRPDEPTQSQVDCLALGLEPEAPHGRGDQLIVDVDVGACHTPTLHLSR